MTALLAIDTAAPRLQLALLHGDGEADVLVEEMSQGHAERLFPALSELLGRNGLGYPQLSRIAVTTGPGSFTGLRIGLSAARGLGLALGIPVVGVPSLLALSLSGRPGQPLAVLLDARRGEAYLQRFSAPGESLGPVELLPMEAARGRLDPAADLLDAPHVDIARLARFARHADPAGFPPEAAYVRAADAKPQARFQVARR